MTTSAANATISFEAPRFNALLAALWLALSLAIGVVVSGGGATLNVSESSVFPSAGSTDLRIATQPANPAPAAVAPPSAGQVADSYAGEDLSALWAAEARLVPLRGAPTWVWALPNDDARKITASHDWDIVAAADRQAGLVVLAWAMKVIPEQEYWNGLCERWLSDPEWGGVSH